MANTSDNIQTTVISTRVRLARNFASYPFPRKMDEAQAEDIVHLVNEGLKGVRGAGQFTKYEISALSRQQIALLKEQYLISPALLKSKKGAAFVTSDNAVSIMVNEEDHLREQCICKGFDLHGAYDRLNLVDDGLAAKYDFAFDKKLGYITACPSNLGTGMRASVMMFLPGLTQSGGLKDLLPKLKRSGLTVRGAFGEGSSSDGCVYQVSNQKTLGLSEEEILSAVASHAENICRLEAKARAEMLKKSATELRDKCLRAFGTLTNCALLSETELFSKIAEVRLGIVLGFLENVDGESFDDFYNDMHPTTFRISNGLEGMSERKCDEVRAETVCKVLPQIVQVVGRKK